MAEWLGLRAAPDGHVFYDFGVVRAEHLAPFAARKAFIYVLEIVAQVLPLVTFARRLSPYWIAFIRCWAVRPDMP